MISEPLLHISVEERFHDELFGLPKDGQKKILHALKDMRRNPTHLSKPLKGHQGVWRRRVDPYRILFTTAQGWVHVYSVQQRGTVYEGMMAKPSAPPTGPPPKGLVQWAIPDLPAQQAAQSLGQAGCWELVWKVVDCRSDQDLEALIDLGIPETLFQRMSGELEVKRSAIEKGSGSVQLIRQNVLDSFFGRLLLLAGGQVPNDLLVVAPWITKWNGPQSSFDAFLRFLRRYPIRTRVITRTPEFPAHSEAVDQLRALPSIELTILKELHAKFFVCDVAPIPFALVSSANSTARSYANWEVGVLVRGSGDAEGFVRDLQGLAIELIAIGKRKKRRHLP